MKRLTERISYDGHSYAVRVEKVEIEHDSIVFDVVGAPKRITLSKRWSEDRTTWTTWTSSFIGAEAVEPRSW